ncbi:MAG: hypothetical protein JXR07_12575 [Reichenbachiella sp.]
MSIYRFIGRIWQYIKRISAVYFSALPGQYTEKKVEILKEFYFLTNSYLKNQNVDYWIAYGTLLGYHREKGILSHDIDLDYGAPGASFESIWNNRNTLPKGLTLENWSDRHRGPKLFFSYKGFDADIYFYEEVNEELVPFLISDIPADMEPVLRQNIYPLHEVDFLGDKTYIPENPKNYLEQCYGYIGPGAAFDKKTGYWYKVK